MLPDEKFFQKTLGDLFNANDDKSFWAAADAHNAGLARLGINKEYTALYFTSMKAFKHALEKDSRSSESDIEELSEIAEKYIEAAEIIIGSQKGLENFKTDQRKKDDPFLADFYAYYAGYVIGARKAARDPKFAKDFFSKTNSDTLASFVMVVSDIVARANASKVVA